MKYLIIVVLLVTGLAANAQQGGQRKYINPEGLSKPNGYSHVVVAGGTIYVAGQVAYNEKGEVVGKGDLRVQATQVFENIKKCLASAGVTFQDVVKVNYYIANYNPEQVSIIREVRALYIPAENPPVSTLVGVQSLVRPELLIEIEVIARMKN